MPLPASTSENLSSAVDRSLLTLQKWVEQHRFAGYEPFDVLNSLLFAGRWPAHGLPAVCLIQFAKRLGGLRLRRWLQVPESRNPKALGLFISAYCDLARSGYDTQAVAEYLNAAKPEGI